MQIKLSLLAFICILLLMSGCSRIIRGDGQVEAREVSIDDFDELAVACPTGNINYSQSEGPASLSVTTDCNVYGMLDIYVSGNKLHIKLKDAYKGKLILPSEFTIHASSEKLEEVGLAGKAEFNLNGVFTAPELELQVAGSGVINLNDSLKVNKLSTSIAGSSTINAKALDVETLDCETAGSGTYNLEGTAQQVSFEVAGKGKVRAFGLKAQDIFCEVAGLGSFEVSAGNSLNVESAGLTRLSYKGELRNFRKEGLVMTRKAD